MIQRAPTPPECLESLREQLGQRPGGILEQIAEQHGVSLLTVIDCLPVEMRSVGPGNLFCEVMGEVSRWGPVTLIVHTSDGIFEFSGSVPEGSLGRGFYNLTAGNGFGGHLRPDRCHSIVFLRRPFMGKHTASIQFFNVAGGSMFKIFVGRDELGELRSDQLEHFDALERRIAEAPSA